MLTPTPDAALMFREAARDTLHSAFAKMMKNAPETESGVKKPEPSPKEVMALHDMRVGSRRLRAALSVFARVFPKSDHRDLESEIADITAALAAVRDLDVQRETLAALAESLPASEAYGVERLRTRLAKARDRAREPLRAALKKLRRSRFEKRFAQALEKATRGKA